MDKLIINKRKMPLVNTFILTGKKKYQSRVINLDNQKLTVVRLRRTKLSMDMDPMGFPKVRV
jgi:hypothetical protein